MLEESESLRMQPDDEKCHAESSRQIHRRVQARDRRLHHLDGHESERPYPSSEHAAELEQRAVELCSALISLGSAGYSFENEV